MRNEFKNSNAKQYIREISNIITDTETAHLEYDEHISLIESEEKADEIKKRLDMYMNMYHWVKAFIVDEVLDRDEMFYSDIDDIYNILENIVELLLGFLVALAMSFLGPWYNTIGNEYGAYVIPFFILVILSIPTLFFINYKFVYKDFEVSKNKKMKLSFFTALANAPYELLIPYGQIASMIIDRMMF